MKRCWSALALAACITVACEDPTAVGDEASEVAIRAGDEQQGPASSTLGEPLEVLVTTASGAALRGVVVIFRIVGSPPGATGANSAAVADSVGVTGLDGSASTFLRLGGVTGEYVVSATLRTARDRSVTFRATATPAATLTSLTPATARALDTITVRGQRFNTSIAGNAVLFDDIAGRISSLSGDSVIRVVVPACLSGGTVDVRVAVGSATTNDLPLGYTSSTPTLQFAVGEGMTVSSTELENCLRLQGNGPRYLVVPQFAAAGQSPNAVSFAITRVAPTGSSLSAVNPFAQMTTPWTGPPPPTSQERFDAAMRRLESEIAPLVAAQPTAVAHAIELAGVTAAPAAPPLNSTRGFQVLANLSATQFKSVTGVLRYAGGNVLIYVDQTSTSSLADADLRRVGDLFDQHLYEIDVATFGSESDLDENGRVLVLMTPVVNALVTTQECIASGAVAGFFYPNDLYLNNQGSNRAELFYTLVPDPSGTHSCAHPLRQVLDLIPPTFIHEFQHMISFNQHVLARGGSSEVVWLNEGLSLIAEELGGRYFEERYPAPFGRSVPSSFFPDSALLFENGLLVNAYQYLASSQQSSVTTFQGFGSLPERGAAWLFLRWLGDQKGDEVFGRLVQTRQTSIRNIEDKSGESFDALFGDFAIAAAADIPGFLFANLPTRHQFTSRDFPRIFGEISSRNGLGPNSPVAFTQLTTLSPVASGSMPPSTMAFYSLPTVGSTPTVAVRFAQPNTVPFPSSLSAQVGLIRVQ